ncbi:MAG: class I SAM-dependent RNA methyltransferase [Candidatus Hydrogenedentes bacterium]|nr:class I SAM-dependent RNA methyltransferase [Candidatus Hydrogenedentota bacterium]
MESTQFTIEISSLAHGGHGVGRIDGQVCFVPYALPGDTARIHITRRAKGVLGAAIDEIVSPAPARAVEQRCAKFGVCGACTWLHFAYPAQAEWKQRIVRDSLNRLAQLDCDVHWVENSELRLGYRTRAEFHASKTSRGFYALGTHDVVDIESCPLCHDHLNSALEKLRALPLDESVEIVVNPEGPEVLVWSRVPNAALRAMFPTAQSPKDRASRAGFLFDGALVVNGGFSQSSLLLNRLLVAEVRAAVADASRILDLYCGSGNFTATLPESTTVFGLDHNRSAIAAAYAIRPGQYRSGDESMFIETLRAEPWDVVILDPPRAGALSIVPALAESKTGRIVYVSCDPATLARDLKKLAAHSWRIAKLTAVDMFPNTAHVETVCVLVR